MTNETSSSSEQPESTMSSSSSPSKPTSLLLLLSEYENALHDRIKELKDMMHPAHNPIYNESLSIEIETLQWVLSQVYRQQQQIQPTEEQQKRAQSSSSSLSSSSSSSALSRLQYVIEYRIKKVKEKISKSYLMEDTDRIWIQVETLEWALRYTFRLLRE